MQEETIYPTGDKPYERVLRNPRGCSQLELLVTIVGERPARNLLQAAGDLSGIYRMGVHDLLGIDGLGERRTAMIMAIREVANLSMVPLARSVTDSAGAAYALFRPNFVGREQEYLYVLLLDTRNRAIGQPIEIYHGSLNTSLIRVSEVFCVAIKANAASIVIAHNHPSGDPSPSPEDVAVTRALIEAGKLLDVEVLDHLVVGDNRFVSMQERGLAF